MLDTGVVSPGIPRFWFFHLNLKFQSRNRISLREGLPRKWDRRMKQIKRILITVVGGTVLAFGVALIVLPGPAFIVIPLGLAILAIEFAWARRWLNKAREFLKRRNASLQSKEPA